MRTIFTTTFLEFTFLHKGLMFEAAKLGTSYMSSMALQDHLVISVQELYNPQALGYVA